MYFTQGTSNALHLTLNGIVSLIKLQLNKDFDFILPGSFRSDRLEGEFGIYWQSVGECYYISVEQTMNNLAQQILKLFSKLDIEEVVSDSKEECCTASLTEGEIFLLNEAFSLKSKYTVRHRRKLLIFRIRICCVQERSST